MTEADDLRRRLRALAEAAYEVFADHGDHRRHADPPSPWEMCRACVDEALVRRERLFSLIAAELAETIASVVPPPRP